jgi:hypothetical protein
MSQRTLDLLKKHIASGQPARSIGALPPGCSLEVKCEQEPVLTPDQPVTHSPAVSCGARTCMQTEAAPADSPAIVTFAESPPKAEMFLLTHRRASR